MEENGVHMIGTLTNVATVVAGTLMGMALKQRIPEKISHAVMQGLGIFTVFIGFNMAFETQNMLVVLFSIVIGTAIGTALDVAGRLERAATRIETRFAGKGSGSGLAAGFLAASLLFCVGPMSIIGSIEDGLVGNYQILMTKALMDGVSSIVFGATMGVGVALSALTILVYQGGLTLAAAAVKGLLSDAAMTEMTAVGGLLIVAIGLNMLEIKRIRVADMLPAIFLVVLFVQIVR